MKAHKLGKESNEALKKKTEVQVKSRAPTYNMFHRMNFLLEFISKENFCDVENFVSEFISLVNDVMTTPYPIEDEHLLDLDKFSTLMNYPNLVNKTFQFHLYNMQFPIDKDWKSDVVYIEHGNVLRASFVHRYYEVLALINSSNREKAIKFTKKFIHSYSPTRNPELAKETKIEKLVDLYNRNMDIINDESDWEILFGMKDGKYFYRNNNCVWVDSLKDYSDKEIKYLICCYGDYPGAQFFYGEPFILTMEHTIAQGDPYCTRVVHDTRENWDLKHFPDEFWKNLKAD